jgi:YVTN family beta-propeller protein
VSTVSVIDTTTNMEIDTVEVGLGSSEGPQGIDVTPDGSLVYVTNNDDVFIIDAITHAVLDTIPVGSHSHGVAITPDGTRAYVTHPHSDSISVIDVATSLLVDTITGLSLPEGMGFLITSQDVPAVSTGGMVVLVLSLLITVTLVLLHRRRASARSG